MKVKDDTNFYLSDEVYNSSYLKAGQKNKTHIVFVSRGSEELNDWKENLGLVVKEDDKEGQFKVYDKFVNDTLGKFKTQDYSFTGHSLGGGLAQYEAVKHLKPAATFAAARAFNKLTDKEQKKALNGEYWDLIKDYYHSDDVVGMLPPNAEVFYRQYLMKRNSSEINLDKFEEFYDENRKTIQKLNGFKEEVISAALAFNNKDKELGNWIKENSKGW
ncbi:alpha/beta hydrolase family protein [Listeria welshimeri]|uniref:DUF2974 domain-containing protein n=1 Tax=Listeria welshimeri TaxID=1643 RepID=UPI001888A039|nr:DUF2974 domain-containing protein [Listeria welshimeri]MBF2580651.1 DUF2974 domain-containing protein [Listeria welshimeri]MBF2583572.1 DUF2974 domain-containing protein [Listeria welshimeri]